MWWMALDLLHKSRKSRRFHARPHGTWFLNVQNHRIVCLSLLWVCYLFQFAKEYGCGVISTWCIVACILKLRMARLRMCLLECCKLPIYACLSIWPLVPASVSHNNGAGRMGSYKEMCSERLFTMLSRFWPPRGRYFRVLSQLISISLEWASPVLVMAFVVLCCISILCASHNVHIYIYK